jgi:hypothetical protein
MTENNPKRTQQEKLGVTRMNRKIIGYSVSSFGLGGLVSTIL